MNKKTPRYIRVFRLSRLIIHVIWGVLQAIIYPYLSRDKQLQMMQNWAAGILKILKIQLHYSGEKPTENIKQAMLVANHVSWLDICVMITVCPTQFVAKSEIRDWPVIGFLCRRVGTLFIKRAKRSDTLRINQEISQVLSRGERVCIFPEGRTSDGTQIRHFHASLLQAAIDVKAMLYPVAIRYLDSNGQVSKDAAYTDITLVGSLHNILKQPYLEAAVVFSDAIPSNDKNRRELARLAEEAVSNNLALPMYHTESEKPSYLPGA